MTARRTLITAITERIAQKRLTAAQAAAALRLTGPKVTALLNKNIEAFTLDELVNLLPALELTVQVVAEPQVSVTAAARRGRRKPVTTPQ